MNGLCLKHVLILLLFISALTVSAQTDLLSDLEPTTQNLDSISTKKLKAISSVNLVREIDNVNNELKLIQKKTQIPASIQKIDSTHIAHYQFILQESNTAEEFIKANPNLQKINNLITKWNGYKTTLTGWQTTVNNQQVRNSRFIDDITEKEKVWGLSYQSAVDTNAPEEILTSINTVWEKTKNTKDSILKNNNYYLVLETKLNEQISITEQVMDDLLELKNSDIYDIFHQRHEAIWNTSFKGATKKPNESDDVESIKNNITNTYSYLKGKTGVILFYFIFISLIALFIKRLKSGYLKFSFKEKSKTHRKAKHIILYKSTICIIFLALLVSKSMFSNTPRLFIDITTLLILICAVPLIRPYMHKKFKDIIFYVILFFILNATKSYVWFSSALYRIYTFFEACLVIFMLYKYTSPYLETRNMALDNFGKLLVRLTPVLYVLCIVSIVSNIFGYTNLTDISLKISTQSGISITFFYSLLMVFNGISLGIINRHYGVKQSYLPADRWSIEKTTLKVTRVIIGIIWTLYFLNILDILSPMLEVIQDTITEPYQLGSLTFTLEGILGFIFTLIITYTITKIISFLINDGDGVLRLLKLPKGIPTAISLVIRYFIMAFGVVLALGALGIDLSKFNLMAGALGLGIGFGLQTVISNFVSGLILVFERPILPGDTVEVNSLLGTVNRIGVRSSSISTFDGAEVVVPNNNLISNDLINWTLSNNIKRIEILIGTSYDSDPNRVLEILTEIANDYQFTLKDPAPKALFSEFGDSSLNFRLLYWVHYEIGLQSKSDISISIYNRFKAEGIEIPFPQRDLNVRNIPENLNFKSFQNEFKAPTTEEPLNKNLEKPFIEPVKTDVDSDDSNNSSSTDEDTK
ncbi:potassium efflux system KefA protein / small-con ductance mechanosensitive channel [Formosa agariphila KMM 3901]|uniref:Potassium efflux system KefA protein / small-con ductance mechanosensitive channel n=2 Tax=Formosa TaxID=225842 RepID=T2KHG0_FORAG|nr:potassium efflux system KefA protein / small-con ductance mechanosensitive channel [Formosa agariphila KMM 3901]